MAQAKLPRLPTSTASSNNHFANTNEHLSEVSLTGPMTRSPFSLGACRSHCTLSFVLPSTVGQEETPGTRSVRSLGQIQGDCGGPEEAGWCLLEVLDTASKLFVKGSPTRLFSGGFLVCDTKGNASRRCTDSHCEFGRRKNEVNICSRIEARLQSLMLTGPFNRSREPPPVLRIDGSAPAFAPLGDAKTVGAPLISP